MIKLLRSVGLASLVGCTMASTGLADGRDGREADSATRLYSQGVHAYFAGRTPQAESLLARALELNDQDPRIYYFRALSRLRLSRDDDARLDMAAGAALEAARETRFAVGTALQRVQGSHRLLLEQYRRQARSRAVTVGAEVARQRAEQMQARDAGALREKVVIPLDELFRTGLPQALSPQEGTRRVDLFQPPRGVSPTEPTEALPASPAFTTNVDPFRDDAEPPASPPTSRPSTETPPPLEPAPIQDNADDNPFNF